MSLVDKIENLQKSPEYLRKRILFIAIAVIMFVVILVWASTLNISLPQEKEEDQVSSPFAIFGEMMQGGYDTSIDVVEGVARKIEGFYKK